MKSRVGFKKYRKILNKSGNFVYNDVYIFNNSTSFFSLYVSNVHNHPIPLLVWKNFPSLKVFNDLGKCGI